MDLPGQRSVVILLAASLCNGAVQFIMAHNTVMMVRIREEFDVSNASVSWIASLFNGFQNLSGEYHNTHQTLIKCLINFGPASETVG